MLDNADNNGTAVRQIAKELHFTLDSRRLRCFGYIINLIVRDILYNKETVIIIDEVDEEDEEDNDEDEGSTEDTLVEDEESPESQDTMDNEARCSRTVWGSDGALGKLHHIVRTIHSSSSLRLAFANLQDDSTTTERTYELLLDNVTRWNSTETMIERALKLQKTINLLTFTEQRS